MTNPSKAWLLPRPVFAAADAAGAIAADDTDVVGDEKADDVDKTAAADGGAEKAAGGDKADVGADGTKADDTAAADAGDTTKGDEKADDAAADKAAPSIALTDDVRDAIAGGDASLRKLLDRHTTLKSLATALKNAQATISSGKLRREMPDPKDEKAMAEWRKAEGIPDDATGYVLPEEITKRLVDEDKPVLASFTEFAHAKGARPDVVAIGTEWYVSQVEAMAAAEANADKEAGSAAEESLRADLGREYKGNVNIAHRFISSIPGLGTDFAVARTPDGRRLVDKPEFILWAADQGRATFGDSDFASEGSEVKHANRRAEIEKIRDTDFERYEREGLNKELHDIIDKDLKRGKR